MQKLLSYNYVYLIPLIFSAFFSLKAFRLNWPKQYKLLSLFLFSSLFIEVFAITWKWYIYKTEYWSYSKSNLWIYNGFLIIRHLYILSFFYYTFHSKALKKAILISVIPFTLFGFYNYFFLQSPHKVSTYTIILMNTTVVLLALSYFRQVIKSDTIVKVNADPGIWISLGLFIYYSGSLPLFIFLNYLIKEHPEIVVSYFYINHALSITMYLLFLISFICKPHPLK